MSQENRHSLFFPDTLNLSFAPEVVWQHLIDAHMFVTQLRERLTEMDAAFPSKGEPVLKRIKGKAVPASRITLQEALRHYLPDRSVLDTLWDSNEKAYHFTFFVLNWKIT